MNRKMGAGGSPLVLEQLRLSWSPAQLAASFEEQAPTSIPSGQDWVLDVAHEACLPALMD